MKTVFTVFCVLAAGAAATRGADDFFDRLDEQLTWATHNDQVRAHVSGTLDLEAYTFERPAPNIIHSNGHAVFNPRLSLFLDAQLGPRVYVFAQSRVDRGFDPGNGGADWRLDEYAIRFTPRDDGAFNLQIGKFATVVGNWVARHHSWGNPFITAPLPYENLLGIFAKQAADSTDMLRRWSHLAPAPTALGEYFDQYRLPIVWGPSYSSGAAISGVIGRVDYAFELKNTSLSSHPDRWDVGRTQWQHPTWSGRIGYRPNESWSFGFSASAGSYLLPSAEPTLPPGRTFDDYREVVWAQDVGFAWHHWQLWAEAFEAVFENPRTGHARTTAYYVEAKYKFTPQFSGALRWNQQFYGYLTDSAGQEVPWARDVWRIDVGPNYRFTPHTELKLQYTVQSGGIGPRAHSQMLAAQYVTRF